MYRYSSSKSVDTIVPTENEHQKLGGGMSAGVKVLSDYEAMVPDPKAKAQLDLLCKLIGKSSRGGVAESGADFKLNLFNNEEEEL